MDVEIVEVRQTWISLGRNATTRKFSFKPIFYERQKGEKLKRVSLDRGLELIKLGWLRFDDTSTLGEWLIENGYGELVIAKQKNSINNG